MNDKLKVVVFSGGRGAGTISEALAQHPQLSLTLLINAYDDGLSTGLLRRFIPGMLGPSDIRKNLSRLIPSEDRSDRAMKELLEFRFPMGTSFSDGLECLQAISETNEPSRFPKLAASLGELSWTRAKALAEDCQAFLDYARAPERARVSFDFSDCSLGNLLFGGRFLRCGRDFNAAIASMSETCHVRGQILNISRGENLVLAGLKEDGTFLRNEAEIVSPQSLTSLSEIFLLSAYLSKSEEESLSPMSAAERKSFLRAKATTPRLNERARAALAEADIIIYGPGTQHSSLFPSYLTEGVAEAIAGNRRAEKIFVANIMKDHEIRRETAASLVEKFLFYMNRKGPAAIPWDQLITRFFFQGAVDKSNAEDYVSFDQSRFPYPVDKVVVTDWEIRDGIHSGGRFRDELIRFVNARVDEKLKSLPHCVSIVVPALNEERTVKRVLHELGVLDFQSMGLSKEIIFVDGGSTDRTLELARSVPEVKVFKLAGERGRGAAIRFGMGKAAGNIIVTFPSDAEYVATDLIPIVLAIVKNEYQAVFGSRAIKCINLSEQIHNIYQRDRLGYLVGKYGGITLSILCLMIYNRYISDALTGIKAFDAQVLRGLQLESNSLDLETEIIAKLSLGQFFILELPVTFFPRRKIDGKKSTLWDGLWALFALFRFRFTKKYAKAIHHYSGV